MVMIIELQWSMYLCYIFIIPPNAQMSVYRYVE